MAIYYVDPTATGANNGTSQADAWVTIGSAVTTLTAGDICYCRAPGNEVLGAGITENTNGDLTTGYIQYIGVNSSWVDDGTRYVLNGNSVASTVLTVSCNYNYWKNFELKNGTSRGCNVTTSGGVTMMDNVYVHDNSSYGMTLENWQSYAYRCIAKNNSRGFELYRGNAILCESIGNSTVAGIYISGPYARIVNCVCHNNGDREIRAGGAASLIYGSVVDGNADEGIYDSQGASFYCFNRSTNNKYGIEVENVGIIEDYNYFNNNSTANYNEINGKILSLANTATSGTDGYEDRANDDFSTGSTATLRRSTVAVGSSTAYMTTGMPANDVSTAPTVTDISPANGTNTAQLTLTGTNFEAAQGTGTVTIGGLAPASYDTWSDTSIQITLNGDQSTGAQDIVVTNDSGTSVTVPNGYVVDDIVPTITDIAPSAGASGAQITLTGTNFEAAQGTGSVTVNAQAATVDSWSNTSVLVTTPSGLSAGNYDVVLTNNTGNSVTAPNGYTVSSISPTITSIQPNTGKHNTPVVIKGTNFGTSGSVIIGTSPITVQTRTATQITGLVGWNQSAGTYNVIVYSDTQDAYGLLANGFTYAPTTGNTIREKIRKAVKFQILRITTANGYNNNVRQCYDPPKNLNDMREYPSVNLFWGREDRDNIHKAANKSLLDLSMDCEIVGYFNDRNDPYAKIDSFIADVQSWIGTDFYITSESGDRTAFEAVYQANEPFGIEQNKPQYGVVVEITIWYHIRLDDPTSMS